MIRAMRRIMARADGNTSRGIRAKIEGWMRAPI
jgi:hypothetical protein